MSGGGGEGRWALWRLLAAGALCLVARACPEACDCRAGSRSVNCSALGLTDVPGDLPADTLDLHLRGNNITEIRAGSFAGVATLRALDLSGNGVRSIGAGAFLELGELSRLDLSHNRIRRLHRETLRHSPRLSRLDLAHNALTALPVGLFYGLRNLSRLRLSGNGLASLERDVVEPLVGLRELSLAGNPWGCDCSLSDLRSWLEWYAYRGGTVDEVRCSFPRSLRDRSVSSLPAEIFTECGVPLPDIPAFSSGPLEPPPPPEDEEEEEDGDEDGDEDGGGLEAAVPATAGPHFCTVRAKQPPVNVRRAVGTLAVAGVVCGVTSLMMVVAAIYGCLYAAMMSRVRGDGGGGGGGDESRERQSLAMEASEEVSEEYAKEPLNPSPA